MYLVRLLSRFIELGDLCFDDVNQLADFFLGVDMHQDDKLIAPKPAQYPLMAHGCAQDPAGNGDRLIPFSVSEPVIDAF